MAHHDEPRVCCASPMRTMGLVEGDPDGLMQANWYCLNCGARWAEPCTGTRDEAGTIHLKREATRCPGCGPEEKIHTEADPVHGTCWSAMCDCWDLDDPIGSGRSAAEAETHLREKWEEMLRNG